MAMRYLNRRRQYLRSPQQRHLEPHQAVFWAYRADIVRFLLLLGQFLLILPVDLAAFWQLKLRSVKSHRNQEIPRQPV